MGTVSAQVDFSDTWEDFYSYTNVKDFIKVDEQVYAIVDNAVFMYNTTTKEIEKRSSIHGLTGETTSSIFYSRIFEKLIIGYESGLLEVLDTRGKITVNTDIKRLTITGAKSINHITEYGNKLLISTPFAIVVYELDKLQFGDTYFIGNSSNSVQVNQTVVFNEQIYAATSEGIFTANANDPNLIDYTKWKQPQGDFAGNFKAVSVFNNAVYCAKNNELFRLENPDAIVRTSTLAQPILDLKSSPEFLTISQPNSALVFDAGMQEIARAENDLDFSFTLHTAYAEGNSIFLGTERFGLLNSQIINPSSYIEIHPSGPSSNDIFSITAENNHIWVVYGGYSTAFAPLQNAEGFSHFNGEAWKNIPFDYTFPARDLVHVTVDPLNINRAYISSYGQTSPDLLTATGGILVVENDEVQEFWNHTNSGLEDLAPDNPNYSSIRINGTAFDDQGNLWVSSSFIRNRLKKRSQDGVWTSYDLNSLMTVQAFGLTELVIDKNQNVWMGSRRNGALVYAPSTNRKTSLTAEVNKGSLPDPNVRTIAVDRNNRIWIGTKKGLVVFNNVGSLFDAAIYDAAPVIVEDDGIAKKLLGDQPVSTIAIDGADNKWFGTDTGGVLATNPSGSKTLFAFNKDNSPLPSNKIVKIKVDNSNGRVFIATDKGMVAFNNNVAPFGEKLEAVYAYPNPARSEHNVITIDGRNGTHLPRGTNVKILDAEGRLVHETNVTEGQELKGGKVIWNKTNLAGRKVASGVYIVLLTLPDKSETAMCKIAIIN
ncbi:hypothetical protein MWU59_02640 [Flavobacteriaceae bacterium F08102]|nr:hypothetical protein [Flavobacteriaceae bacterium F08102]